MLNHSVECNLSHYRPACSGDSQLLRVHPSSSSTEVSLTMLRFAELTVSRYLQCGAFEFNVL